MEILEENLSNLLPFSKEEADEQLTEREKYDTVLLGFRDDMLEALNTMLCNSSQWNLKTVAKVRRATFLICREVVDSATDIHKLKADKIEILHAPIALLGQLLRQVLSTPQLFKDAKDRKNFQRVTLRAVKAAHKALLTSNEVVAILDTACEKAFNDARPAYGNPEKDKGLWPARSSNTVEIGSDEMRNAIIRKMDFKVMASFLPLGGCAVVEQWRADVDEVVEAILQVNRTKETESQGTTQQGTYLTAIDEGEKSLTRTRRLLDQSADNTYSGIMYDGKITSGQLLGTLEGLEPQVPGQQPFGVWETTFMDISRMKEARAERASRVDGFGRVW